MKYLRNEFFDDHFDIKNNNQLIGKTLICLGSKVNCIIGRNINFLGEVLRMKYENAIAMLLPNSVFYEDIIALAIKLIEHNNPNTQSHILKNLLENASATIKFRTNYLKDDLKILVNLTVNKMESIEIEKQKKIYLQWNRIRETKLKNEIQRVDRAKRLREVEYIKEEMRVEEQLLWFFEKADKIELEIDDKIEYYPKRWFGKKKKPRLIDETYVPPEIYSKKN